MSETETETCWICMEYGDLISVCECPTKVHTECLAKWQIHRIGHKEESTCRFCDKSFPDWKELYKYENGTVDTLQLKVVFNGREHIISGSPNRIDEFQKRIYKICNIPEHYKYRVTYICNIPNNSGIIELQSDGIQSHQFSSALYLASVNRQQNQRKQQSTSYLAVEHLDQEQTNTQCFPNLYDFLFRNIICKILYHFHR